VVNNVLEKLNDTFRRAPYVKMRSVFIDLASRASPVTLEESFGIMDSLTTVSEQGNEWISGAFADERLRELMLRLKALKIHELRNDVVHKDAYRPTRETVDQAISEFGEDVLPLGVRLNAESNDINGYSSSTRSQPWTQS
jgi:hypothetical protein